MAELVLKLKITGVRRAKAVLALALIPVRLGLPVPAPYVALAERLAVSLIGVRVPR